MLEKAHRNCTDLPELAIKNRNLLEKIMEKYGFVGEPTEWWHFNDINCHIYGVLDVSIESL